jgi:hypothetical protein
MRRLVVIKNRGFMVDSEIIFIKKFLSFKTWEERKFKNK